MIRAVLCGVVCLSPGIPLRAQQKAVPDRHAYPVTVGTFIQWFLVKDWGDAQWRAEFRAMKAVGMQYLVFTPTADSKAHVTYYPTQLPGYHLAEGWSDVVDACLRNAEKEGVKVFLSLNFSEDWWQKEGNDPAWLDTQMQDGNAIATELYRRYAGKYPEAFYGWYWAWEVDNLNFRSPQQRQTLAHALDSSVRHLKALNARMPVMLCPFMSADSGTPEAYRQLWTYIFAHSALGRGDIFCPQDCVGAGGLKLEQVPVWFAALRAAVATKPGLEFWSDTETFDATDWTAAPLNRFVAQLKAVQPYVARSITFAYSHYYSPNTANPGFQQTYLGYVRTGKLETIPPSAPTHLQAAPLPDGGITLHWDPATDNTGVCGYVVLRNGARIARKQVSRQEARSSSPLTLLDKSAPSGTEITYTVRAYDFAGNLSPAVRVIVSRALQFRE
jgi:hypothetical protein